MRPRLETETDEAKGSLEAQVAVATSAARDQERWTESYFDRSTESVRRHVLEETGDAR